jgi:hypothetical protein
MCSKHSLASFLLIFVTKQTKTILNRFRSLHPLPPEPEGQTRFKPHLAEGDNQKKTTLIGGFLLASCTDLDIVTHF